MTTHTWTRQLPLASRLGAVWILTGLGMVGCATLGDRGQALVPTRYQVKTGPFLLYSNIPIPADAPAVRCLQSLERDLTDQLAYRVGTENSPVEIYVLNDRNAFTHFLRYYYPELPPRRAFFLAQGARRVIYTYMSPRLDEDLRHEGTHALLRGYYGDLPLWLDEGLAEYFETATSSLADQQEHLARLPDDLKEGWLPNLPRLESLSDIHQMTPRDYREAWAWVHLMLNGDEAGKAVLIDYLNRTRQGTPPESLSQVIQTRGGTSKALVAHLETIRSRTLARKPAAQDQLIRLQDRPPEPPVKVSPQARFGFFRRLGALLGF